MSGLTGCKVAPPTLACLPENARDWIYKDVNQADEKSPSRSQKVTAKVATLYFDRSASMVGYLNGADNDNRPLHVLINNLPDVVRRAGTGSQYAAFGAGIEKLAANKAGVLLDPRFYSDCSNGVGQSCDSDLRAVLEEIEKKPDELATVVTDLWYDKDGAEKEGAVRLQAALTAILASGRSVAIYGIDAPFRGRLYGIPVGGNETFSMDHVGTHPLFLLVVGGKGDVIEFDRQLENTVGILRTGLEKGTIHRSIFTIKPGPLQPVRKAPVVLGKEPGFHPTYIEAYPAVDGKPALAIQQFELVIGRDAARSAAAPARPAYWQAPQADDFLPNTVHEGPLKANVSLWKRADEDDPCSRWTSAGRLVEDKPIGGGAGDEAQFRFDLSTAALSSRIRRPGIYLISGQLERQSVTQPNRADAWAERWSLSPESASRLVQRDRWPYPFFPTLNLVPVMTIMENALQDATEREGGGIVGFAVLVKATK